VAIDDATTSGSTKPLTAWRTMWMKKNDTGAFVLKSRERATKLRAVSDIYLQYLTRMQEAALYDFDDMIMRVVHAMEVFPELLFNLQETYQYILVDEFQDTNMAQMRILSNLTNNEIHNDRPNILVVGDDDQAIYSFQGANVGNISGFLERFAQTKQITLVDNYRSSETILTHARQVITQGSDRLEARMPQLNKTLTAHRSEEGSVALVELPTIHDEHTWLVKQIEALQKRGVTGSSVAVLARRHHELVALLPYFAEKGIRVNYERRDNVLDQELIVAIEHIAQLLIALYEQRYSDANSLLPRLLAHPAFAVSPLTIWQLSLKAQHNHQTWMELLALTPELQPLHDWLISTAQQLADTPLEHVMDRIVGSRPQASGFVSPLFAYFFSPQRLEETPDAYLTHLDALRTIRTKLRDYRPDETPTLQSFVEFIRHHRQLGSTITSVRPATHTSDDAVNVMTAHKSKGLEFDHVFVIGAIDTTWGERVRTRSRLIGYPQNLPLAPAGDTFNDRLRLFFVAMTRARTHLTLSYSAADARQKTTLPASFLVGENWQTQHHERPATIQQLVQSAEIAWYQPIIDPIQPTMHQLLQPMLDSYKLSSTHLTNFLDVTRGGPQAFLLTNLLRFPQAISPSAAYGSAVHATLQRAHAHLSATGHQRPIEDILHDFEEQLRAQRLTENDFASYLQKGSDVLLAFLEAMYHHFSRTQKTELSFANQSVFLGKAHLTGSLDLVDITGTSITVTDYKTGKALRSWTGKTDYEKIKLHKYKQQLMFYNLLTLHSRDYHTYSFEKGVLQFVEPTHAGEIVALEAHFSRDDLEDFSQLIQKVWQHITTLNLPSTGSYPPTYAGIVQFEHDLLANTLVE
jgi:DNA helicase-2/ATP-dependent DNA helicase PcrA